MRNQAYTTTMYLIIVIFVFLLSHLVLSTTSSTTSAPSLSSAPTETSSLLSFFSETNGATWVNSTNWREGSPCSPAWYGITCDESNTFVTEIKLSNNKLKGSLSVLKHLSKLKQLTKIDLGTFNGDNEYGATYDEGQQNHIVGNSNDVAVLGALSNLTYLDLSGWDMQGDIDNFNTLSTKLEFLSVQSQPLAATFKQVNNFPFKLSLKSLTMGWMPNLSGSLDDVDFAKWTKLEEIKLTNGVDWEEFCATISGSMDFVQKLPNLRVINFSCSYITGNLANLKSLTNLTHLEVFDSSISGDVMNLKSLSELIILDLGNTAVTGSLSSLQNMAKLKYLFIYYSNVTGTSVDISRLTNLNVFMIDRVSGNLADLQGLKQLRDLSVFGSPALTGSLTDVLPLINANLSHLVVSTCLISGNLEDISKWGKLQNIAFAHTLITGNLNSLSSLANLEFIDLSNLKIEGSLSSLHSSRFPNIYNLQLPYNNIKGKLSDMGAISKLRQISLRGNYGVSGGIPPEFIQNNPKLNILDLSEMNIGGSIPDMFDATPDLQIVSLHASNFIGSILSSLSKLEHLFILTLHSNKFTGTMPSLNPFASIRVLTIGNNLLSCHIPSVKIANRSKKGNFIQDVPVSYYDQPSTTLSVVGNLIKGPLPTWVSPGEQASDVLYLSSSAIPNWLNILIRVLVGLAVFILFLIIIREGNAYREYANSLVSNKLEVAHDINAYTTSATAIVAGFGLLLLIPVYLPSSTLYQCGDPIMKLSMAYLNEAWASWAVAAEFLLYSCLMCLLCFWNVKLFHSPSTVIKQKTEVKDVFRLFITICVVILATFILSIPTFIYGVSQSTPANNLLTSSTGIPLGYLMSGVMGPTMAIISTVFIPMVAYTMGTYSVGERGTQASVAMWARYLSGRSSAIMQIMLMFNLIIIPLVSGLIFANGCFSGYILLWDSCRDPESFNFKWQVNRVPFYYLTHESVCGLQRPSGGCVRQLIVIWFPVIFSQYVTSAFLGPIISMLRASDMLAPLRRRIKESFLNIDISDTNRNVASRTMAVVVSAELSQVLIFGFFAPVLYGIALISFLMRATAFYVANSKLSNKPVLFRPQFSYTVFITPIALAVLMPLSYWENSWGGQQLVWSISGLTLLASCVLIISVSFGKLKGSADLKRFGLGNKFRNHGTAIGIAMQLSSVRKIDNLPIDEPNNIDIQSSQSSNLPSKLGLYVVSVFIMVARGLERLMSLFGKSHNIHTPGIQNDSKDEIVDIVITNSLCDESIGNPSDSVKNVEPISDLTCSPTSISVNSRSAVTYNNDVVFTRFFTDLENRLLSNLSARCSVSTKPISTSNNDASESPTIQEFTRFESGLENIRLSVIRYPERDEPRDDVPIDSRNAIVDIKINNPLYEATVEKNQVLIPSTPDTTLQTGSTVNISPISTYRAHMEAMRESVPEFKNFESRLANRRLSVRKAK